MADGDLTTHDQRVTLRDGLQAVVRTFAWRPSEPRLRKRNHLAVRDVLVVPDPSRTMDAVMPLIEALLTASDRPVKAATFDAVGRGDSSEGARDDGGAADDLIDICDALGAHDTGVIALGNGVRTLLASGPKRPSLAARIALIDGGPSLDSVGIARAAALLKKATAPDSWAQAADVARSIAPGKFPALNDADWTTIARSIWREERGKLVPMVPPTDIEERELWGELAVFKHVPALLLRGETSPLMPAELASKISKCHGRMAIAPIAGQGHVPHLRAADDVAPLVDFLKR